MLNKGFHMKKVAVLGGLGKMGRGIALLLLEMLSFENEPFELHLIDPNQKARDEVRNYLAESLKRFSEKRIVELRKLYAHSPLISNVEIIDTFLKEKLAYVFFHQFVEEANDCDWIFEAALETLDFKVDLLKRTPKKALIFTNTSSIPIHLLEEKAGLKDRIIGFHFYNPPPLQPLMEIIAIKEGPLKELSLDLARKMKKTIVFSNDVAGFIGNGHFLREVDLAFQLAKKEGFEKVELATKKLLMRPMGIFELMDFVGYQVVYNIAEVMKTYGPYKGDLTQLKQWIDQKTKPDIKPIESDWKTLAKSPDKEKIIKERIQQLQNDNSKEAELAIRFLEQSAHFMEELVDLKIANNIKDVAEVLKLGFHHLYAPNEVLYAIR